MTAIYEYGYILGNIMFPVIFYCFADYVKIQVGITVFEMIVFGFYYFIVKESPRWQLTREKFDELEENLFRTAKVTGRYDSDHEIRAKIQCLIKNHVTNKELQEKKEEKEESDQTRTDKNTSNSTPSILDVWKDVWKVPSLLKLCLILYFTWFAEALTGYGKFYNIESIGGNLFLNVLVMSFGGIITNGILYFSISRFKRKTLLIFFISLNSLSLFLTALSSFDEERIMARVIFMLLSTVAGIASYHMVYIYTTESFPTSMRQISIGTCSIFARLGSCFAPFVKELTRATHLFVSLTAFSLLSLISMILLTLVPDTTDIQLPDTITQTQAVSFKRNQDQENKQTA